MGMRILIALLASGALIASGLWFAIRTHRKFEKTMRSDELRAMQIDGTLPPELRDANLERMPLSGFGLDISSRDLRRIWLADLIQSLWWLWVPAVFAVCLLIAVLVG